MVARADENRGRRVRRVHDAPRDPAEAHGDVLDAAEGADGLRQPIDAFATGGRGRTVHRDHGFARVVARHARVAAGAVALRSTMRAPAGPSAIRVTLAGREADLERVRFIRTERDA